LIDGPQHPDQFVHGEAVAVFQCPLVMQPPPGEQIRRRHGGQQRMEQITAEPITALQAVTDRPEGFRQLGKRGDDPPIPGEELLLEIDGDAHGEKIARVELLRVTFREADPDGFGGGFAEK